MNVQRSTKALCALQMHPSHRIADFASPHPRLFALCQHWELDRRSHLCTCAPIARPSNLLKERVAAVTVV
jgi:hypothetical protein